MIQFLTIVGIVARLGSVHTNRLRLRAGIGSRTFPISSAEEAIKRPGPESSQQIIPSISTEGAMGTIDSTPQVRCERKG